MVIKVAQINLGRSRAAMSEMEKVVVEEGIELLLIQEPYWRCDYRTGLGTLVCVPVDGEVWACALLVNKNINVVLLKSYSCNKFVTLRVSKGSDEWIVVNSYFKFGDGIDMYLEKLAKVIRNFKGEKVVISLDANAKSPLWFSTETDDRGGLLEDAIISLGLEVLNVESGVTTFENTRGIGTNIDVTLANRRGARSVSDWIICDELYVSDHRMISYVLSQGNENRINLNAIKVGSFLIKNANWLMFDWLIVNGVERMQETQDSVNEEVRMLERTIKDACYGSIPVAGTGEKKVSWWTEEVGLLRRSKNKLERSWKRCRRLYGCDDVRTEVARQAYVRKRNDYVGAIRSEKRRSWERLILEESEVDPWGRIYKIIYKQRKRDIVLNSLKVDGVLVEDTVGIVEGLLTGLLPDDVEPESGIHERIREVIPRYEGVEVGDEDLFTMEELKICVMEMKNKRAPGIDGIKAEILKRCFGRVREKLLGIINRGWSEGVFPSDWKIGVLKIFLKDDSRDPHVVKSYRPVTLLPVLGKVMERMIVMRLKRFIDETIFFGENQFGFVKGKGTVDALCELRSRVEASTDKYVVGVFLDISGAFDNAWWPLVLFNLKMAGCPRMLYNIICSYLSDRTAILNINGVERSKKLTKGCPQGSILGPVLWNVLLEDLLRMALGEGVSIIAYADDLVLTVSGNSRVDLEERGKIALKRIVEWSFMAKLKFSPDKSQTMMLKGRFAKWRAPVFKIRDERIVYVREVKYLGVWIGEELQCVGHVEKLVDKVRGYFYKLAAIARVNCGYSNKSLAVLYQGLFLSVLTYGCEFWGKELDRRKCRENLLRVQRQILIRINKAYRTISREANLVIAGLPPIDLVIEERRARWADKKDGMERGESHRMRRRELLDKWQDRWVASEKGRETFDYFPDVRARVRQPLRAANHYSTQVISGHGNFGAKLHGFGLRESGECLVCGVPEFASHVVFLCPRYVEERYEMIQVLNAKGLWMEKRSCVRDEETFEAFVRMVTRIGRRREVEEREAAERDAVDDLDVDEDAGADT